MKKVIGMMIAALAALFAFNVHADSSYAFGEVGAGYDFHGHHESAGLGAGFLSASNTEGTTTVASGGVLGGTTLNHGSASADGSAGGNAYASNDGHTATAMSNSGSSVGTEIHGSGTSSIVGMSGSLATADLAHHHHWY